MKRHPSQRQAARQFFRSLDRIRALNFSELEEVSSANIARSVCDATGYPTPLALVPFVDDLRGEQ